MILTRYIIKEHIAPFIFSTLMIIFVFLLNILFRDLGRILSRGINILTIFEFLALNLAWIIALAVPMAVLIATLTTFGRFSADNEVTAMKASGISFYKLLFPIFVISIFLMIGLIIYNNSILPHFNHRASLLMGDIFRKRPTLKFEPNVVFTDIPKMNLLTKNIIEQGDSSRLEDIVIDDLNEEDIKRTIFAESGNLKFDKNADRLFLDLFNVEVHDITIDDYSKYRKSQHDHYRINVDIPGLSLKRSESKHRGDREKSVTMMKNDIQKNQTSIKQRQENMEQLVQRYMREDFNLKLIEKADQLSIISTNDGIKPTKRQIQTIHNRIENIRNQMGVEQRIIRSHLRSIDKLLVEIHKKYSIPVACLVFVLIGAPLGILTRKGNMGVAAGISLLFFLLYWVCLIGGEELGDRQIISPIFGMWVANIIVGSFGIYLVILTGKEYRPIQWQKIKSKFSKKSLSYD